MEGRPADHRCLGQGVREASNEDRRAHHGGAQDAPDLGEGSHFDQLRTAIVCGRTPGVAT